MRREILLVEDNPDDVMLTKRALIENRLANELHVIDDGQQALDYLFCEGEYKGQELHDMPYVVLLDIKLPTISGIEVLRRLRADKRTKYLPVVVLTSSSAESDIVDSYKCGANSYVRKPVSFDDFREAIRELGLYWLVLNKSLQ